MFEPRYHGNFSDKEDVESAFEEDLSDYEILIAVYDTGSYEGDAHVLARKDGKLYEVSVSHCSCNGLEGSWAPYEVTPEYLALRSEGLEKSLYESGVDYSNEIANFLRYLKENAQ